jgi:acetyl-CoA C-acetyltransferase
MISSSDPIVIAAAARTPMGSFQGELKKETAVTLGAAAIRETLLRAGIDGDDIDEVVMGCVLSAGLGQAPGRQAAIGGGVPESVPASTLNKMWHEGCDVCDRSGCSRQRQCRAGRRHGKHDQRAVPA